MLSVDEDRALRERIVDRLMLRATQRGGFVERTELEDFPISRLETRRLVDRSRGIWNPRDLNATLSIVSSPDGPYADSDVEGGLFHYDYRAGSVAGDNAKLRRAQELDLPVILLLKLRPGVYSPIAPVYVIGDDLSRRRFVIAVDEGLRFLARPGELSEVERRYAERITRHRLHQSMFRGMVVHAYQVRCAVCRLRHGELLDAAHISPDRSETGSAVVNNGLSLCKIHHAAYDRNLMGISPDYRVAINKELLLEEDGPMLRHGLQEMHGVPLVLPSRATEHPDRDRLADRFNEFLGS